MIFEAFVDESTRKISGVALAAYRARSREIRESRRKLSLLREEEEEEEEEAEEAEDEEEEGEEEYACWVLSETFLGSAVWQKMDEWGHLSEIIIFTSVILSNYLGRRPRMKSHSYVVCEAPSAYLISPSILAAAMQPHCPPGAAQETPAKRRRVCLIACLNEEVVYRGT